jgi:anthranilate phosphoribosyltransferase
MDLITLTDHLKTGANLSLGQIRLGCDFLLDSENSVTARADFLHALNIKGETPEEVAGFVEVLLERSVPLPFIGEGCLDVCGTGGDRTGFFNISTTVMFIVAGAGARVVKHGNRGVTSKSGGADVLEALGVKIGLSPEEAARALDAAGCCFLFAAAFHPTFRHVVPVRQELAARGTTSIFNIIGPLMNPVRPDFQMAGGFDARLLPTYARVFQKLGRRRAWAVHGTGPEGFRVDEVSPLGKSIVQACENGSLSEFEIHPETLGLRDIQATELVGGDASENARIILDILEGRERGSRRDVVQLNAAAALVVADRAENLQSAWELAGASIDEGKALHALKQLQRITQG